MYIVRVYHDLEQTQIIGLIYFVKIKHIIEFSKKLIRYNDIKNNTTTKIYKTYKNLFRIEEVRGDHVCKYFSDYFYHSKQDKTRQIEKRKEVMRAFCR